MSSDLTPEQRAALNVSKAFHFQLERLAKELAEFLHNWQPSDYPPNTYQSREELVQALMQAALRDATAMDAAKETVEAKCVGGPWAGFKIPVRSVNVRLGADSSGEYVYEEVYDAKLDGVATRFYVWKAKAEAA